MTYSPQLNLRSAYNFQQSLITIDQYLAFAKENNFSFAFYAELNTMFGVAEFTKKAQALGIKPIIGLTVELKQEPLILIAKNLVGYQKLCHLSSALNNGDNFSWTENLELFLTSDLIAITNNQEIKMMIENISCQIEIYFQTISLHKISYLNFDQYETLVVLKSIQNNVITNDINGVEHEYYLSDEQINQHWDSKVNNAKIIEIAQKVEFNLFSQKNNHLIKFKTPENIPAGNFLANLCQESLNSYFKYFKKTNQINNEYLDRLKYELDIIQKMGFENYFLVVWDYVKFAKDQNIMVGPGRGSVAGSLVAFLLGITTVDPIEYNLLFERFLNPERLSMPDIDIDFQDNRRDEVIEYLFEKYGPNHVATIVTYQSIGAKSAIRDVARTMPLNLKIVNDISKHIPSFVFIQSLQSAIKNSTVLQKYEQEYPDLFTHAEALIGLPRQTGTHAAGIVLSNCDLRDIIPIRLGYNGIYQTQFDMNYLEDLGLIKMDILGLRNLTVLQEIKTSILASTKKEINFNQIPLHDGKTFFNLRQGNTSGIFQLESPMMTKVIMDMKVNSIEDISAASALFRPGPQKMIPEYIKRKNSSLPTQQYLIDPSLNDILGSTYGIIVYQEQVIQMLQKVANFSLSKADIVRRGMGKKDFEKLHSVKDEFIANAVKNHYSPQKAIMIWDWIEKFADYGFNKSHSIAYSYISYWLAYLKTHYSAEFYCSLLNSVIGNVEKTLQYIQELKTHGIKMIPPSVKNINFNYIGINKKITMPLILIKGIGNEFIRQLREQYLQDKTYLASVFKFVAAMVNRGLTQKVFNALAWSGALDLFGYERADLVTNYEVIFTFAKFNNDLQLIDESLYPELELIKIDKEIQVENERDYLGFYLSSHPIEKIRNENADWPTIKLNEVLKNDGNKIILCYISSISTKIDKYGKTMAFLELMDETDSINLTIFASLYDRIQHDFKSSSIIIAEIQVDEFNGKKNAHLTNLIKVIRK